jgi:hypothetical protein
MMRTIQKRREYARAVIIQYLSRPSSPTIAEAGQPTTLAQFNCLVNCHYPCLQTAPLLDKGGFWFNFPLLPGFSSYACAFLLFTPHRKQHVLYVLGRGTASQRAQSNARSRSLGFDRLALDADTWNGLNKTWIPKFYEFPKEKEKNPDKSKPLNLWTPRWSE